MKYKKPELYKDYFTCPHCETLSQHEWWSRGWDESIEVDSDTMKVEDRIVKSNLCELKISKCIACNEGTIWVKDEMVYPDNGGAPSPNKNMPESVKGYYLEAASISSKSPRGAAALLRLGIQVLCKELKEKGENINDDIANLVKKGLPIEIQQALDAVRVIGNAAVHPGEINTDDEEVTIILFNLVNIIVDDTITRKKKIAEAYNMIPKKKREFIEKRDSKG